MKRGAIFESILTGILTVGAVAYEPFLAYAVILALLLRLAGWLGGQPLRRSGFHLPLLGLLFCLAISTWVTPLPAVTAVHSLRLLLGVILLLSLESALDSSSWLSFVPGLVLSLTLLLAASGLLFISWSDKYVFLPQLSKLLPRAQMVLDTLEHPNVMGGCLAVLLAGLGGWILFRWGDLGWIARLGLGGAAGFTGAVLFLTQARTAIFSLGVGLVLLVVMRWRRGWILVTTGLVLCLGLSLYFGPQKIWYALGGETGGVATFSARTEIWLRAKLILQDFPFSGIGMGSFGDVVDAYFPLGVQAVHIPHAHNLYLQIALDLGIPGLLAWLSGWGVVLWNAWRLYRSREPAWRAWGAAALCCQAVMGLGGFLDCVVWDSRPAVLVWGLWGLVLAAGRIQAASLPKER